MKPVFIIGCPRTGSKIYLNAISNFSEVNISPELHILDPVWLHQDFKRVVNKRIGRLDNVASKKKLIKLIDSEVFFGSFWYMNRISGKDLRERLKNKEWTTKNLFQAILKEDAKNKNKNRIGAKFPVHFSYVDKLFEWFPNCKVIHITRDPRAIYSSQLFKHLKKKENKKGIISRLIILLYIIFIYKWDYRIYMRNVDRDGYLLSKYEDIVLDFDSKMKSICQFIGIEFKKEMRNIQVVGSSFMETKNNSGLSTDSLYRFKKNLTTAELKIIEQMCKKEMIEKGYFDG